MLKQYLKYKFTGLSILFQIKPTHALRYFGKECCKTFSVYNEPTLSCAKSHTHMYQVFFFFLFNTRSRKATIIPQHVSSFERMEDTLINRICLYCRFTLSRCGSVSCPSQAFREDPSSSSKSRWRHMADLFCPVAVDLQLLWLLRLTVETSLCPGGVCRYRGIWVN